LGIAAPLPLFVTKIDAAQNALIVGVRDCLNREGLSCEVARWAWQPVESGQRVLAQMRAHARAVAAQVVSATESDFEIRFDEPQAGVSPGQMCVLYHEDEARGDEVLGAGTII
jgi:tRNA-specific 2-thiouridylase